MPESLSCIDVFVSQVVFHLHVFLLLLYFLIFFGVVCCCILENQ